METKVAGLPVALVVDSWIAVATRAFCLHPLGAHAAWHGADPMPRVVERVVGHFGACLSKGYQETEGITLGIGRWANPKWGYRLREDLFAFVIRACARDAAGRTLQYHAELVEAVGRIASDLLREFPVVVEDA